MMMKDMTMPKMTEDQMKMWEKFMMEEKTMFEKMPQAVQDKFNEKNKYYSTEEGFQDLSVLIKDNFLVCDKNQDGMLDWDEYWTCKQSFWKSEDVIYGGHMEMTMDQVKQRFDFERWSGKAGMTFEDCMMSMKMRLDQWKTYQMMMPKTD